MSLWSRRLVGLGPMFFMHVTRVRISPRLQIILFLKKHFINFAIILTMNGNASIGLFGILGIIFIVLKLVDIIDWSWWWVLAPFWIEAIIFVLFIIIWILFESRG